MVIHRETFLHFLQNHAGEAMENGFVSFSRFASTQSFSFSFFTFIAGCREIKNTFLSSRLLKALEEDPD